MKYLTLLTLLLALITLASCGEQESSSEAYVKSQTEKINAVMASNNAFNDMNAKDEFKPRTPSSMRVKNNALYSQAVDELRKVYANNSGRNCIIFSQYLRGEGTTLSYDSPSQAHFKHACEAYAAKTPYTLAEILDPKAIKHFKQETLRATCQQQEKHVDGRFIKRLKTCEKFFASTKK